MRYKKYPMNLPFIQIMNEQGEITDKSLCPKDLDDATIRQLYEKMLFIKMADQKALNLQRQGRMGTYASCRGQEAIQVASASVLQKQDWMVPAFRETGAMLLHGVPLKNIYLYWMGNEWGSHMPSDVNVLPISIPVGSQMLHAVGIGMAITKKKLLKINKKGERSERAGERGSGLVGPDSSEAELINKSDQIAITYFGDGATSEGDFHEAMNFAGLYKSPVVFICQNNQYAISVPRQLQTASHTLAQKAFAYGFEGIQVDGNDLLACYKVCKEAVEKARTQKIPTLIEAVTYRIGDHTTSDDAARYRDEKEHEEWKKKDPLLRLQKYLATKNLWSQKIEDELIQKFEPEIIKIAEEAEQTATNPQDIFDYTYAEIPQRLQNQKEELLEFLKRNPTKSD